MIVRYKMRKESDGEAVWYNGKSIGSEDGSSNPYLMLIICVTLEASYNLFSFLICKTRR